jgi:hypothetical protein
MVIKMSLLDKYKKYRLSQKEKKLAKENEELEANAEKEKKIVEMQENIARQKLAKEKKLAEIRKMNKEASNLNRAKTAVRGLGAAIKEGGRSLVKNAERRGDLKYDNKNSTFGFQQMEKSTRPTGMDINRLNENKGNTWNLKQKTPVAPQGKMNFGKVFQKEYAGFNKDMLEQSGGSMLKSHQTINESGFNKNLKGSSLLTSEFGNRKNDPIASKQWGKW